MIGRNLTWCVGAVVLSATSAAAAITFVTPSTSTPVPIPTFLTSADFNRDGRADVALSSTQSNKVSVLLGSRAGTLTSNITYDLGKQLGSLAAADINGDGNADIAIADRRGPGVHILVGVGNGTFAQPVFVSAGRTPAAVAILDLDNANGADLIVVDEAEDRVLILMNSGRTPLGFTAGGQFAVGQGPESVLLADFNGDGHADIATLNTASNQVRNASVLLFDRITDGLPVFHLVANFGTNDSPSDLTAENFGGDDSIDLAMLNSPGGGLNGSIDVLVGQGNGLLTTGPSLTIPCPVFTGEITCRGRAFAAADFDGDDVLDLAITQTDPRAASSEDWLALYGGIGDGLYAPGPVLGTDPVPSVVTIADVTGDGSPDIIVGSERARTIEVFVNTSAGTIADRLPGQACDTDTQCTTGFCRDTVCCRTECGEGERCNLPTQLGTCTPHGQQRPRGDRCDNGLQCESGFCVDQVCCIAGTCPIGARCDIPTSAGLCTVPADDGHECERTQHCRSGFCIDSLCCNEGCPDGRCDAPGREGTCTGNLTDGEICSANAQCTSGVCDAAALVCCAERCSQSQRCTSDGATCIQDNTPTPTSSAAPSPTITPTSPPRCAGDCDDSQTVAVSELVTGVTIALGRTAIDTCTAFDTSGDDRVSVNELVAAVGSALRGCGS